MEAKRKFSHKNAVFAQIAGVTLALAFAVPAVMPARGQDASTPAGSAATRSQSDPLAGLTPENRALFEKLRNAAEQNNNAATLAAGKKLLPALPPGTPVCNFVTQVTAESAVETGDTAYALSLLKPFTTVYPEDWRAAALLARAYAESGEEALRDQQIAHVIALHEKTADPQFASLHIFPIQKVALHSGYAMFLYPFKPLGHFNVYLAALIFTPEGKLNYRIELESADADQAFYKPKHPGDRRFSIDSIRNASVDGKPSESQALFGFVDGTFNYDRMRDLMVKAANGESVRAK